jgi:hypothetical protein
VTLAKQHIIIGLTMASLIFTDHPHPHEGEWEDSGAEEVRKLIITLM